MKQKRVPLELADNFAAFSGRETDFSAQKRRLKKAISEDLTDRQKLYASAYYFSGMTIYDIAESYGVSPSTVSRTLKRARANIYRVMKYAMGSHGEAL